MSQKTMNTTMHMNLKESLGYGLLKINRENLVKHFIPRVLALNTIKDLNAEDMDRLKINIKQCIDDFLTDETSYTNSDDKIDDKIDDKTDDNSDDESPTKTLTETVKIIFNKLKKDPWTDICDDIQRCENIN